MKRTGTHKAAGLIVPHADCVSFKLQEGWMMDRLLLLLPQRRCRLPHALCPFLFLLLFLTLVIIGRSYRLRIINIGAITGRRITGRLWFGPRSFLEGGCCC